jgi:excinuclease UvrABC nuclease subunit
VISGLQEKMLKKASELKFEEAGKIKQDIESIKSLEEIQIVREAVK